MSKRLGGRAARRELRESPLADDIKPLRPGLSSDRFHPLSDADVLRVHEAVMEILETIGLSQATKSAVGYLKGAGALIGDDGRVRFPRALIEDTIAKAARDFVLCGQDPAHDLQLSGSRTYFGSAGAAVHVVDIDKREYRDSTLHDLYQIGRIVDQCEHIHFFQRPLVARDVIDPLEMDCNTCYAAVSATTKHVGSSWVLPEHVERSVEMLHLIAGGERAWRARPFVSMSCCFVVPPLRFAEDATDCMEVAVKAGMPVLLLSAGLVAECLAGLVYVNAIVPGHPAIFGTWPFVSDLRTGAMSGGSGEQAILSAACGQMGRYYNLPCGTAAGMTDAKLPDAQSGYEKGYTDSLVGNSGVNMVYESVGMHGSLMGCCYESYVIDNDMLGAINRTVRSIEVNDKTLSLDVMRDVCIGGPSHYLGHDQTIELMQREYIYPSIADRSSPKEWREAGAPDLITRAQEKVQQLLKHYPQHIGEDVDRAIRERLNIHLPRSAMLPPGH